MAIALHTSRFPAEPYAAERSDTLPAEVRRLLDDPTAGEVAWQKFVERYSRLLLRVAFAFSQGYDGAMDRYLFILEALREGEYCRLRRFAADGRGKFSTWLVVVARRLCVDHHRRRYGRRRTTPAGHTTSARQIRRRLSDLAGDPRLLDSVPDAANADPLETLAEADRGAALRQALEGLEPRDQLLLKLRFEHDLTAREIATLLDLPTPFHVYRRARALCADLRGRLQPIPEEAGAH
jgi:RNA polymerase sigma factor (sigma-70 family)